MTAILGNEILRRNLEEKRPFAAFFLQKQNPANMGGGVEL
jgi:hypothetical protein